MRRKAPQILFPLLFVFTLTLVLTGCVAPNVLTKVGGDLHGYKKVYFVTDEDDPRGVCPRVASRLKQAGFAVTVVTPGGPAVAEQGSGFVISPEGDVLTCAHVVQGLTNATIWVEGERYLCRILNYNTNFDLALLKVEGDHPPFHPLRLSSDDHYSLGQNVFTMGFPLADVLGVSPRLNNGLVSAKVGLNDDTNFIQISVPTQPGNSGSPLLNANGEVIGMVSATLNPLKVLLQTGGDLPQNVNFAIKLSSIQSYLAGLKITLPTNTINTIAATNLDGAERSIALVRSGDVSNEDLKARALVCVCKYQSIHDFDWHFRVIVIAFVDARSGRTVLTVAQALGNYPEDKQLDYLFAEVSDKFFPDKPNPFKK